MAKKTQLRFAEFAGPFLGLILQLRASSEFGGDAAVLRQRISNFLDEFERNARREGQEPGAISSAKFALAAFMDETIMQSKWQHSDTWVTNSLCMELFQRMDAGEEFFNRLEAIRRDAAQNSGLLEIYYLCMALGFKGRYAIFDADKLSLIKDDTYKALQSVTGELGTALSPAGYPKAEITETVGDAIPVWQIAIALGGVAVISWVILFWLSGNALN